MSLSKFAPLLLVLGLAACGTRETLEVRPFHLREREEDFDSDPMIEAERNRRLYGAIGVREQEQRLGYYYTVLWNDPDTGAGPVEVVFEYRQASTGSQVLRQVREFPAGQEEGRVEFRVTGDDYLKGGRVLAWEFTLLRGGREVASKRSYLWR